MSSQMMMPNQMVNLMNTLRMVNPQRFNEINQMMQMNQDPSQYIKQYMANSSNDKIQRVFTRAKQFGVSDNVLGMVQNSFNNN